MNTEIVLFDHPAPLPVATLRSHSVADLASRLRGARHDGWRWLRPRAVPAAVALVGMVAVLGAAEYLTRLARRTPVQAVQPQVAEASSPSTITVDSNPPSSYRITLVPLRTTK